MFLTNKFENCKYCKAGETHAHLDPGVSFQHIPSAEEIAKIKQAYKAYKPNNFKVKYDNVPIKWLNK